MKNQQYRKGEIGERGRKLYGERVRPNVDESTQRGRFVAIDVETGDWEAADNELDAAGRLEERRPAARGRLYLTRIGLGFGAKIGGRPYKAASSR